MALSGVLSSWLILAMNSDFTLLASSASMRAECSATRARWRSSASPKSDAYSFISELVFWLPKAPLNITLFYLLLIRRGDPKGAQDNVRLTGVLSWQELFRSA